MHEFVEEGLGGCGEVFDPWGTGRLGVGDAAVDVGDGVVGVEEDGQQRMKSTAAEERSLDL